MKYCLFLATFSVLFGSSSVMAQLRWEVGDYKTNLNQDVFDSLQKQKDKCLTGAASGDASIKGMYDALAYIAADNRCASSKINKITVGPSTMQDKTTTGSAGASSVAGNKEKWEKPECLINIHYSNVTGGSGKIKFETASSKTAELNWYANGGDSMDMTAPPKEITWTADDWLYGHQDTDVASSNLPFYWELESKGLCDPNIKAKASTSTPADKPSESGGQAGEAKSK